MKYKATFELRLGSMIDEIKSFEDKINDSMQKFGYDEKLFTTAEIFSIDITTEKEFTEADEYKVKSLLISKIIKIMPKYDIRLKSFSRQSEQSVLQSAE